MKHRQPSIAQVSINVALWLAFALVVAVAVGLSDRLRAEEPAQLELAISSTALGAADQMPLPAVDMVAQFNAREWLAAHAEATPKSWRTPPSGVPVDRWVSVVTAGFHERGEAYAFMFDPGDGAMTLAAHVGHRKRMIRGAMQWTSPLAPLLSAFRRLYDSRDSQVRRPRLTLTIVQSTVAPSAEAAVAKEPGKDFQVDQALTVPPEKVLPPLEAMLYATACEAGWAPISGAAPSSARIEVQVKDQACGFVVTFAHAGRETVLRKPHVGWEEYDDFFQRLFRAAIGDSLETDFTRLGKEPLQVLAATRDTVFCLVDQELASFDLTSGQQRWRIVIPQSKAIRAVRKIESYAVRDDPSSDKLAGDQVATPRLFRYSTALAAVNLEDGLLTPLAPVAAARASGFDVLADGTAAVAQPRTIGLYRKAAQMWQHTSDVDITCGPVLSDDSVIAGNTSGELFALATSDGHELWRTRPGSPQSGPLAGPLVRIGDHLLAFLRVVDTLTAVDAKQGRTIWQCPLGDVLLETPRVFGSSLVVATKGNRILRLNRETGAIEQQAQWPTWLVSVRPISLAGESRLAVLDLEGRVAVLDPITFKATREVQLPTQWAGGVALAGPMSRAWPVVTAADPKDEILSAIATAAKATQPMLLVGDLEGFLYLVPPLSSE